MERKCQFHLIDLMIILTKHEGYRSFFLFIFDFDLYDQTTKDSNQQMMTKLYDVKLEVSYEKSWKELSNGKMK